MANWKDIHRDFTSELQKQWENNGFSYEICKEWISAGLQANDAKQITEMISLNLSMMGLNSSTIDLGLDGLSIPDQTSEQIAQVEVFPKKW